jgi:hypothetical protein
MQKPSCEYAKKQFKNKNLPPQKAISSQKIIFAFL